MSGQDAKLERLRHAISCATLLEKTQPAWSLDKKGSSRHALKYRRGPGEVVIVNHDGRGWWDPHSAAKGDVFDLVKFLDPSLSFGQVRQLLRPLIGIVPSFPKALRESASVTYGTTISERWDGRPRLRRGSRAWNYLTGERGLSPAILVAADGYDAVREGHYGSAWFAHRDGVGNVSHIEIRGPDFKGSLRGGTKTLFRAAGNGMQRIRFALTEAPIDALSLAALEEIRPDTVYAATGGGMGPATEAAIASMLAAIAPLPGAHLVSGTDANLAGDRFAARHAEMAAAARIAFERLRPPEGADWNDVLKQGRGL